jgi:hypothetical protein
MKKLTNHPGHLQMRPAADVASSNGASAMAPPLQLSTDEDDQSSGFHMGSLSLGNWASRLQLGSQPPNLSPGLLNQPQSQPNFINPGPGPANTPGINNLIRPGGSGSNFNLRLGNDENNLSGSYNFGNGNATLGARLANRLSFGVGLDGNREPNNVNLGVHPGRFNFGAHMNPQNNSFGGNFGVNQIPGVGDLDISGNANPEAGTFGLGAGINNFLGSRFNLGANYSHGEQDQRFMLNLGGRF